MLTGAVLAIGSAPRRHQRDHEEEFVRGTAVRQVRVEEHEDGDDDNCHEDGRAGHAPCAVVTVRCPPGRFRRHEDEVKEAHQQRYAAAP